MRETTLKVAKLAVVGLALLVAWGLLYEIFSARTDHTSLFMSGRKENKRRLVELFAAFANRNGLSTNIGYATDDQGKTLTVIEAIGGNSWLWMANAPLSGEAPAPCERHFEGYPDPEQFEIRARSRFRFLPSNRPRELQNGLEDVLRKEGLAFQRAPWSCGAAALAENTSTGRQR